MKYPQHQFEQLVDVLSQLSEYFDLSGENLSVLHYIAYKHSGVTTYILRQLLKQL